MSNIASLVVSLEANIAKFSTDMSRASSETTRAMQSISSAASVAKAGIAGLASAFSLGVVMRWTEDVIASASALDDLADATGSSVEGLSKLANVAKVSGASFETIDGALKKLAIGLAGVDDETGKAGKALAALGIQARDPAQALEEIAQKFAQMQDGPEKAAWAVQIFGKAGASLLPILKDISQNSTVVGTVTGDMAREAEALEKSWRSLSVQAGGLKTAILSDIIPTLNEWIENVKAARAAGLGWFASLDLGTTYADRLQPRIETLAASIEKAKANLRTDSGFDGIMGWLKTSPEELAALNREMAVLLGLLAKAQQGANADKTDRYLMGMQGAPVGYLGKLPTPPSDSDNAKVKKAADGWKEFADAIKAAHENALAWEVAGQELQKIQDALTKAIADGNTSMASFVDKQFEAIRAYNEQTDAIGKTTEQLNNAELARQAEIRDMRLMAGWGQDAIDIYDGWAAAIARRNGALGDESGRTAERKFVDDMARAAERIEDGLTDAFMRAAESGRGFFKSLARDLYNMFSQLVLRPIVQGVMAPLAGGVASMLYGGGAGAQGMSGGGIGSYMQTGQSLFNLGGASSTAYGAGVGFATSGMGASLGLSTAFTDVAAGGAFATSSVMTSAGTALAGLAAAAPYIAAVVAVAYALYQAFGQQPGGPKVGGYAAAGNITAWNRTDQFANGGFQAGHFTPNEMDAALQPVVDAWVKSVGATVEALGGTSGSYGFDLGIDKDPNGEAANRIGVRANVNGKQVYNYWSGNDALGRDDATLQAAIELESKRALVAALKASDLPAQIAAVFNTVTAETMTSAEVDNLMAFGSAMKAVMDAIGGDVNADAATAWANSQRSSVETLKVMGDEVIRLASEMDGSTESMQALASATGSYRSAVVQLLVAIRQVAQQAEQMQGNLVQTIQTAGMTWDQSFNYWNNIANQQAALLATATSPEQVAQISTAYYTALGNAFSVVPAELQATYREPILGALSTFGSAVETVLQNIGLSISGSTVSPFAAADQALTNAAGRFDNSAATMQTASATSLQAANISLDAANINLRAANTPLVVRLAGSEVNG